MNKSKILLYGAIFIILFSTARCFASDKGPEIKGRFVFDSNRQSFSDIFITENGKTRLLLKNAGHPVWSASGKIIACTSIDDELKKYGFWIVDYNNNNKEFIEMPAGLGMPVIFGWSPDDTKIYYVPHSLVRSEYKNKVYYYNLLSKTHTKIIELDEKFYIQVFKISPKGDKFIISGSAGMRNLASYISNSDGTNLRMIGKYRGNSAWYPDNEHIVYITNISEDGQQYSYDIPARGYFFRMNINTGKIEKLWRCNIPWLMDIKISRDGKYFYYVASVPGGGRAIYVSPIDNPDKVIQVTHPVPLTSVPGSHSHDDNPDWYQEGK